MPGGACTAEWCNGFVLRGSDENPQAEDNTSCMSLLSNIKL
jgi:hypothetical protein